MPRCSGLLPLTIFKFALFLTIINNFVFLIFAHTFVCSASLTRRTFFTMKQSSYYVEMMLRRKRRKGGRYILILLFISR